MFYKAALQSLSLPPTSNGHSIQPEFQDDIEMVTLACQRHGHALQHASSRLRNDKSVCLVAMQKYGSALEYASTAMQNDKDVVMAALHRFGIAMRYASAELKDDSEAALVAVLNSKGAALSQVSERLKKDRDLVRTAISLDGRSIQSAHLHFRTDPISCGIAVDRNPWSIEFLEELHINHPKTLIQLACKAIQSEWRIYQHLPTTIVKDSTTVAQLAVAALQVWKPGGSIGSECKYSFLSSQFYRKENSSKLHRKLPVHLIRMIVNFAARREEKPPQFAHDVVRTLHP